MTVQPVARPRPVPGLRIVQGAARHRPRALAWVLFSFMAIAIFFTLIAARTSLDKSAFELQEIGRSIEVEQGRFEELKLEIARLSSPARIAPLAESMGMVLPKKVTRVGADSIVRLETDREERWADLKSILAAAP